MHLKKLLNIKIYSRICIQKNYEYRNISLKDYIIIPYAQYHVRVMRLPGLKSNLCCLKRNTLKKKPTTLQGYIYIPKNAFVKVRLS